MPKYYSHPQDTPHLNQQSSDSINIAEEFYILSSNIIRKCSFFQVILQDILYDVHQEDVYRSSQLIKDLSNPKSRLEFLNFHNRMIRDIHISRVFNFSKELYVELYDLRNCLAHEDWFSSEQFPNCLMLAQISEKSKVNFISRKIQHLDEASAKESYRYITKYIKSVKVLSLEKMRKAHSDISLCNWCLMQISFFLKEIDREKAEELKKAFFIYKGTSHLFPCEITDQKNMIWRSNSEKSIYK